MPHTALSAQSAAPGPARARSARTALGLPNTTLAALAPFLDDYGVREHPGSDGAGATYLVDDNARALALSSLMPRDSEAAPLAEASLAFLIHARRGDGRYVDTPAPADAPQLDRASAAAIRGLAIASTRAPWSQVRRISRELFEEARGFEPRGAAVAAVVCLGALEIARSANDASTTADVLIARAEDVLRVEPAPTEIVPAHARLELTQFDGAALPAALDALDAAFSAHLHDGLFRFGDDRRERPADAADAVDAGTSALRLSRDPRWGGVATLAAAWFTGKNTAASPMWLAERHLVADGIDRGVASTDCTASAMLAMIDVVFRTRSLHVRDQRP